jgi:hypothetical protein
VNSTTANYSADLQSQCLSLAFMEQTRANVHQIFASGEGLSDAWEVVGVKRKAWQRTLKTLAYVFNVPVENIGRIGVAIEREARILEVPLYPSEEAFYKTCWDWRRPVLRKEVCVQGRGLLRDGEMVYPDTEDTFLALVNVFNKLGQFFLPKGGACETVTIRTRDGFRHTLSVAHGLVSKSGGYSYAFVDNAFDYGCYCLHCKCHVNASHVTCPALSPIVGK